VVGLVHRRTPLHEVPILAMKTSLIHAVARAVVRVALWLPVRGESREVLNEGFLAALNTRLAVLSSPEARESLIAEAERFEWALHMTRGTVRRRLS
jgi:hypothetical protein